MLTPKDVEEQRFPLVQFRKGYDINSVDNFLDTLTADYTALFEENATLKAKMKVLVQYISDQSRHIRDLELAAAQEPEDEPVTPVLTVLPPMEPSEAAEPDSLAQEQPEEEEENEPVGV